MNMSKLKLMNYRVRRCLLEYELGLSADRYETPVEYEGRQSQATECRSLEMERNSTSALVRMIRSFATGIRHEEL